MSDNNFLNKALTDAVLTRRSFVKWSAALGGTAALAGGLNYGLKAVETAAAEAPPQEQVFRSACNPECAHCALLVHVRNGNVVRVTPDPDFPQRPCLRGYSRLQWTYHPDRVKYPLKRVGERGEGQWERISWDEALDLVADNLRKVRDEHGPEAVLFQGGAVMSALRLFFISRFANAFGEGTTTATLGQLCCAAQGEAEVATVGYRFSALENFQDAKFMISWGHNPALTYTPMYRYILDAQDAGARHVTIDPRYSETASKSDEWLAPMPGTDAALAMAMIHVILTEDLYDEAFVMEKTNLPFLVNETSGKLLREADILADGDAEAFLVWDSATDAPARPDEAVTPVLEGEFELDGGIIARTVFTRLKERVAQYTPERASDITGVPADRITALARDFAAIKPALINSCMSGAQRTSYGEYFVASLVYLEALTGNLGVRGGGLNDIGGPLVLGTLNVGGMVAPYPPNVKGGIPCTLLGANLLVDDPYPIKAIVWQGKGLGQQPNSMALREAFKKMDFVVVMEHFITDAAELADVVLPAATVFEYHELLASHINYYYQFIDQAIPPLWEARSDPWIYSQLAQRLGFGDLFDKTDEEWVNYLLEPLELTTDDLREGPAWMWGDEKYNIFGVAWKEPPFWFFKDTPFTTASGRVEFHSAHWEKGGFEPMVDYFPPEESAETTPELARKYPLHSVNSKIRTKVHSSFALMPWLGEICPEPWVDMHVDDAAARNIQDGDKVEVFNDRGSIQVTARVHTGIRPGVVGLQNGWWVQQGGNASVVSNDAPSAIAYGHTLNSTLVEVRRV